MPPSQKFSRLNSSSMPLSSVPLSSTRSLKARLQVLSRPRVWGSVSILLIASYGLFQYWGGLGQRVSSGQDDAINPAQRSPFLNSQSNFSSPDFSNSRLGNLPTSNGLPQTYMTPGLTSTSPKTTGSPIKLNTFNPFTTNSVTASPSGGDPLNLPSATAGSSSNFSNPDDVNSGTVHSISPLQAGLDRNFSPRQASSSDPMASSDPTGSNPVSAVGNSTDSNFIGSNSVGDNSTEPMLSPVGTAQFQPYVPRTSPPSGSTGYTLPPAFRTPANNESNDASGFSNFSRPQPLPGFTSTQPRQSMGSSSTGSQIPQSSQYQTPQYQSPQYQSPQNDPFSVPRTTPGRSIGGGQINTFSNP